MIAQAESLPTPLPLPLETGAEWRARAVAGRVQRAGAERELPLRGDPGAGRAATGAR